MLPSDLQVKHKFARVNGLQYHYVEKGSGPLVLLLHGFPENWWAWRYQFHALAAAGFRVVAPDQRGYNDTDTAGPYDLATLSSDIVELIRALGEQKAHVIGHDWGGAVAFHLAAHYPERVDKLAVLSSPHPAKMAEALKTRRSQLARSWYMFLFQVPVLPERALAKRADKLFPLFYRKAARDPRAFTPAELKPFIDSARKPGVAKAMLGWYRAAFRQAVLQRGKALSYPRIAADTLLIWTSDDVALGYDDLVPGTERWVPNLRVEKLERVGHFPQAERPEVVNELLVHFLPETRVTVVLAEVGENKISVIKEIRNITGLGMKDARELVETAPKAIVEQAGLQEAERIQKVLAAAGAKVELRQ